MVARTLRTILTVLVLGATPGFAQDPIPILDTFPTAGSCRAILGLGSVLYTGAGGYLVTTDVSDPGAPQLLGTTWLGEQVQDAALITLADRTLVAAALGHRGMRLIDVTDPSAPQLCGTLTTGEAWRLVWLAPRLYVAAADGGVAIVDVGDPDEPIITGQVPVRPAHSPRAVAGRPGRLFVAAYDDSLEAFALGDPDHPLLLGGRRGSYLALDCNGPLLAAATVTGLEIIDVSALSGLPVVGTWAPADPDGRPHDVLLTADRLWLADRVLGLHLLAVSAEGVPSPLDLQAWPTGQPFALGRAGDLVALGTADLGAVLLETAGDAIVERGRVTEPFPSTPTLPAAGGTAAVAADRLLTCLAFQSPPSGVPPGAVTLSDFAIEACGFDGTFAVLGCRRDSYPHTRLAVIDVGDPTDPQLIHFGHGLPTGANSHTQQVEVRDHVAYVLCDFLKIMDVTEYDQWGPVDVGGYGHSHHLGRFELVEGQRICIWDVEAGGLVMLDSSNLWSMVVTETLPVPGPPRALASGGGRLYVANGVTVRVFDITVPGASQLLAAVTVGGYVQDLAVTAAGLWVSLGSDGLERWDLADPQAPALAATLRDCGRIDALAASGDLVLAVAPYTGLLWLGDTLTAGPQIMPAALILHQNQPNPFNPLTRIAWDLPAEAPVRLDVLDVRGRVVRTLVDGMQPTGYGTALWDGRDDGERAVASGVYLYRLEASGATATRTMTLVK